MENNRVSIGITNSFSDVYSALSVAVGTKLAIQNQGPDEILVCIAPTATNNAGYILQPFEFLIVPAGSTGCFVKCMENPLGRISAQVGGWNVPTAQIDERVYTGLKGLTVQSFTEVNSKNGTQYEFSFVNEALAASANLDVVLTVGSKPVLIKNKDISFTGTEISSVVYKGAVFTAGTALSIYNLNTTAGFGAPLSAAKQQPTITDTGSQISANVKSYGIANQGNKTSGTFQTSGAEIVLQPNTNYLFRITNLNGEACKVSGYVSFYEGELSSEN